MAPPLNAASLGQRSGQATASPRLAAVADGMGMAHETIQTRPTITRTCEKLHRMQEHRLEALEGGDFTSSQEQRYNKLRRELVQLTMKVHLNNSQIERWVDQIYALNQRLVGLEARLLRLAVGCGVARESFLEQYSGGELDRKWLDRVRRLPGGGWREFANKHSGEIEEIRRSVAAIADEAGLPLGWRGAARPANEARRSTS